MTNLSPYRLGNVISIAGASLVLVSEDKKNYYFVYLKKAVRNNEPCKVPKEHLTGEIVLKEITLEFLSELAREKGEMLVIKFNTSGKGFIDVLNKFSSQSFSFTQDPNETLGEFCLRVARSRKYL